MIMKSRPCTCLRCSSSSHVTAAVFLSRSSCYLARLKVHRTHGQRKRAHFNPSAGERRSSPCGVRPNMRTKHLLAWSSHLTVDLRPSPGAAALYSCMCTERCRSLAGKPSSAVCTAVLCGFTFGFSLCATGRPATDTAAWRGWDNPGCGGVWWTWDCMCFQPRVR